MNIYREVKGEKEESRTPRDVSFILDLPEKLRDLDRVWIAIEKEYLESLEDPEAEDVLSKALNEGKVFLARKMNIPFEIEFKDGETFSGKKGDYIFEGDQDVFSVKDKETVEKEYAAHKRLSDRFADEEEIKQWAEDVMEGRRTDATPAQAENALKKFMRIRGSISTLDHDDLLRALSIHYDAGIRKKVALNRNTPIDTIEALVSDEDFGVQRALCAATRLPVELYAQMVDFAKKNGGAKGMEKLLILTENQDVPLALLVDIAKWLGQRPEQEGGLFQERLLAALKKMDISEIDKALGTTQKAQGRVR